jgi:hypothetical protein
MGKVTFNDLQEARSEDLKRVYKLDDRGLEKAVRKHWDGINTNEGRRAFYETVYNNKRKS